MVDAFDAVERFAPGTLHGAPSVVGICTTRPKYLVFDGDATQPAYVVEFGEKQRLVRTHRILSELATTIPSDIARSVCCEPWTNGTYVHIQEGRLGVPWFRVSDTVSTRHEWHALLGRAAAAMVRLHVATRTVGWTAPVAAGEELRRQATLCGENGIVLSAAVLSCVDRWSHSLNSRGPFRGCWQHGDFSLNNLLVAPESMAIIDFEEFGRTLVPLHDAFGLALSVVLSQEERCPLSLSECIAECLQLACADEGGEDHTSGLLMHHLLWRINQSIGSPRRDTLRRVLLRWVDDLADGRLSVRFVGIGIRGTGADQAMAATPLIERTPATVAYQRDSIHIVHSTCP